MLPKLGARMWSSKIIRPVKEEDKEQRGYLQQEMIEESLLTTSTIRALHLADLITELNGTSPSSSAAIGLAYYHI